MDTSARRSRRWSSLTAAAWTRPISPGPRPARARRPGLVRDRRQRDNYPERHRAMALAIAAEFGLPVTIDPAPRKSWRRPAYRANQPQIAATTASTSSSSVSASPPRIAALPRWPTATMPIIAATTGRAAAQPANSTSSARSTTRSDQGRFRELSHEASLPTWDEPASACLSSRVPLLRSDRREASRHRAGGRGPAGSRISRAPRAPSRRCRAIRGRADEMPRLLEPGISQAIDRALRALGSVMWRSTCAGIDWEA